MVEQDKVKRLPLNELTAISPIDGRYRRNTEILAPYVSEFALIKTRVEIEGKYLVALSDVGVVRELFPEERETLSTFGPNLSLEQAGRIKDIEDETQHDVKAMERGFREFLAGTTLSDAIEKIHFALTSEDVNNLAYRLILKRATNQVAIPALNQIVDGLVDRAEQFKSVPMMARTHGQDAVPTTVGKEFANMAVRLNTQAGKLADQRLTGKVNGAVGNLNAHKFAAPEVDWIKFSQEFVESLDLKPNLFTTQINPYEDVIEMFQTYQRINGVILDIDQDIWRYISDGWLVQQVRSGEVGSSTMPQKVNPIRFENSEGNAQMANSIWEGLDRKLAVSRLQRDLSDSTSIRNIGSGIGYGLIAYQNTLDGLSRVRPDESLISQSLNENWVILTEGVQTDLRRREDVVDPYSLVASVSRGEKVGPEQWRDWVESLDIDRDLKPKFAEMTPATYIGEAVKLTEMAIEEIRASRKKALPQSQT